ncbi:MAG TPA: hypothetical protein VEV81_03350, partial [Pyrinomonadaceae bacterium]|nr:hypothetical protein [Pyrinomonadaceae bacterium]
IEPYTLKIEVPTQPNAKQPNKLQQAQPLTLRTSTSTVFMSIGLMAPGKKEPLFLPDVFPTYAPQVADPNSLIRQRRETRSN